MFHEAIQKIKVARFLWTTVVCCIVVFVLQFSWVQFIVSFCFYELLCNYILVIFYALA